MRFRSILPFVLVAAGCSNADTEPQSGRALFAANCASCHGVSGRGDGPAGATLAPPPADLTRIAARRGGVWPVLEVMAIVDGYARYSEARPGMPVLPQMTEGRLVRFETGNGAPRATPANLIAVTRYLETIQDPVPERYVP